MENILMEAMFEIPAQKNVKSVNIFKDVITKDKKPKIEFFTKEEIQKNKKELITSPAKEIATKNT
jgi:ATP-dependent protease Clp ATPase subunit